MITVRIFRRAGRKFFEAQWEDPVTGRTKTRTTKRSVKRDAERFAARLEEQLATGTYREVEHVTWREACEKFETEVFPAQAEKTAARMRSLWRLVERTINPARLAGIQEDQIAAVVAELRNLGRSPFTVKTHLVRLGQFLGWAVERKLLARVPTIPSDVGTLTPRRGRPITEEEFDRMIAKTEEIVGEEDAAEWKHLLRGLWKSGLRLGEAMALHWTDDSEICVELDGSRPMFRIQAIVDKARQFRVFPVAPDFFDFLNETPAAGRVGYVFNPKGCKVTSGRPLLDWVSKRISEIGEKAGVKVSEGRKGEIKYASAHDFRRAFGFRWAMRVRAPILMQLMRHKSISTTMTFYVGRDAQAAADELWRVATDTFTNTAHSRPPAARRKRKKPA